MNDVGTEAVPVERAATFMSQEPKFSFDELEEDERRLRRVRLLVDLTAAVIRSRPLLRGEAEQAVEQLRDRVLEIFPDKGAVFDLVYRSRLHRLIESRFGPPV
jgi:hypothetical protein